MNTLTYTNEDGKEVSLAELAQTCSDLGEHVDALIEIAKSRTEAFDSYELIGAMMVFAASLSAIGKQLYGMRPDMQRHGTRE